MMKHPSCRLWVPTPTANEFGCSDIPRLLARRDRIKAEKKNGNGFGLTLAQHVAIQTWSTPTARAWKDANCFSESLRNTPSLGAQVGGKLNPTWVEWLMGFPLGWTELEGSATPSSRKSRS
jgi:hypothetical protein